MPQQDSTTTEPTMTEVKPPTYDVGWAHEGCADDRNWGKAVVIEQRRALQTMLDRFGDATEKWAKEPAIIHAHNHDATVGLSDFGRRLAVNTQPCRWAVLGSLYEKPAEGHVPDGVRLPVLDQGSEQQHAGDTGAGDADARHGQAGSEQEVGDADG